MTFTKQEFRPILFFAIITFIAHFWHFPNLGLYEDDYFLISQPMTMNLKDFADFMSWHILNFNVTEGRPLLYLIEFSLGWIGHLIGDFQPLYLINYLVIFTDAILCYFFLKSLWNQPIFVFSGTLAFILYPADTNHAYLTNVCIYTAIALLLSAFLTYIYNLKLLSYLLIFASLFCYETVFPLFIIAPLLKNTWDKNIFKSLGKHTIILVLMLLTVFVARKLTGEARISNLDTLTLILTPLKQMAIGPVVSMSMFIYRPWQTLLHLNSELIIFIIVAFIGIFFGLYQLTINPELADQQINNNDNYPIIKKLACLGLTLLILSYPLFFTRSAMAINGRDSRVHTTAVIGASLLIGLIVYLLVNFTKNYRFTQQLTQGSLAIFFALLLGFGLTVQQANELTWKYQQSFWTDIIKLCPDLQPETIILVDAPLKIGEHLHSFIQWGTPLTLRQIYHFPDSWAQLEKMPVMNDKPRWFYWRKYTFYPKVYRLNANWTD
ncbi:MAG TPA: hypothetical protein V6C58_01130, partial [Allocoleopsis sp.]